MLHIEVNNTACGTELPTAMLEKKRNVAGGSEKVPKTRPPETMPSSTQKYCLYVSVSTASHT
jgi:hypothetical protein